MVVHLLSVAFTGFIFWLAVPGSNLFSWHPTCMAVAFVTLLLQAIVIFSPESSLFQVLKEILSMYVLHSNLQEKWNRNKIFCSTY